MVKAKNIAPSILRQVKPDVYLSSIPRAVAEDLRAGKGDGIVWINTVAGEWLVKRIDQLEIVVSEDEAASIQTYMETSDGNLYEDI